MQINNPSSSGTSIAMLKTGNSRFNNFMPIASIGTGTSYSANQMGATKIFVPGNVTIRPAISVSVATAGAFMNAALYLADATTGLPSTKAYDLGQWDMSVTGLTANANVSVAAGEYWLVFGCSAIIGSANVLSAASVTAQPNGTFSVAGIAPRLTATQAYVNPLPANNVAAWANNTSAFASPILLSLV